MMVTPPQAAQALRATCTVDVGLLYLTHPLSANVELKRWTNEVVG